MKINRLRHNIYKHKHETIMTENIRQIWPMAGAMPHLDSPLPCKFNLYKP